METREESMRTTKKPAIELKNSEGVFLDLQRAEERRQTVQDAAVGK